MSWVYFPDGMSGTLTTLVSAAGPWGEWLRVPLTTPGWERLVEGSPVTRLVVEVGPPPVDTLSWSPAARGMATDAIHAALEWAGTRGVTLYLRPQANHIISDIPSTLAMLRAQPRLLLALDQLALLTDGMRENQRLHLERMRSAFGGHPQLGCVFASDAQDMDGFSAPVVWAG